MPNLIKIGKSVAEIWPFNGFKMAAVLRLGFVGRVFGPPTMTTWLSLLFTKFGGNRCSSFDNMSLSIFALLA